MSHESIFEAQHELVFSLSFCIHDILILLSSHLELSELIEVVCSDPVIALQVLEEDDALDGLVVCVGIFEHVMVLLVLIVMLMPTRRSQL